jgi:hypothetical protein
MINHGQGLEQARGLLCLYESLVLKVIHRTIMYLWGVWFEGHPQRSKVEHVLAKIEPLGGWKRDRKFSHRRIFPAVSIFLRKNPTWVENSDQATRDRNKISYAKTTGTGTKLVMPISQPYSQFPV